MTRRQDRQLSVEIVSANFTITTVAPHQDGPQGSDLADRVRSTLGPLVKQLDLPRIHVMAEGRTVLLHGDVDTEEHAHLIEEAVAGLAQVGVVESHLHVGLIAGDSRPSQGDPGPSAMYRALVATAEAIGISGPAALAAVHGTLNAVLDQVPRDERAHLVGHFPADVCALAKPRRMLGDEREHWKTELALDAAAALRGGIALDDAQVLVPAVIGVIREHVPEEDADVQGTLTRRLRDLWQVSVDPNAPVTADELQH